MVFACNSSSSSILYYTLAAVVPGTRYQVRGSDRSRVPFCDCRKTILVYTVLVPVTFVATVQVLLVWRCPTDMSTSYSTRSTTPRRLVVSMFHFAKIFLCHHICIFLCVDRTFVVRSRESNTRLSHKNESNEFSHGYQD